MPIGHLLVRADLVTDAQLSRALEVQNLAGGRIGTLLLERTSLGEDDLGKMLALQQGCAYVSWNTLSSLPPETLAVLSPRFALKHNAIPYECGEGYVKMALRDPNDLATLDELVFVTGRKLFVGVAPEVRIYQALEKHYGKVRAPRYAILADRLSRAPKTAAPASSAPPPPPGLFAEGAAIPAVTAPSPALTAPPAPTPIREFPVSSELPGRVPETGRGSESPPMAWSTFLTAPAEPESPGEPEAIAWEDTTGARSRPKPVNPIASAASVHESETLEPEVPDTRSEEPLQGSSPPPSDADFGRILAATERDTIAGAVLAALVPRFPGAAILSSRSSGVTGWSAAGKDADPVAFRSFSISWTEPSVFLNARLSRSFYLGPLPSLRCHDRLVAALGDWPGECLVQPVFLGDKPVAFLYVSSPSPGSLSASDLAYVRELCDVASVALANAIRLKKDEI
jgi:type II secretion system (T2SS) protein E